MDARIAWRRVKLCGVCLLVLSLAVLMEAQAGVADRVSGAYIGEDDLGIE